LSQTAKVVFDDGEGVGGLASKEIKNKNVEKKEGMKFWEELNRKVFLLYFFLKV
jgi:hypothetical protein